MERQVYWSGAQHMIFPRPRDFRSAKPRKAETLNCGHRLKRRDRRGHVGVGNPACLADSRVTLHSHWL